MIVVIAFPQNGVLACPGGVDLMAEAMRRRADVVGGIPHVERSREAGVASRHHVFDLAERHDALIDVHCDEIDDDQSRFLEVMAELAVEQGWQGRVTESHAVAMAYYSPGYMAKLLPKLVQAEMRFAVNPTENLPLQGWGRRCRWRAGSPRSRSCSRRAERRPRPGLDRRPLVPDR